jgi:hypothetical protein
MSLKTAPQGATTLEKIDREIVVARREMIAKTAEHTKATTEARALIEAGATDDDIDASERRATLALRASVRLRNELSALEARRVQVAAAARAAELARLHRSYSVALRMHAKAARAACETATALFVLRHEYEVAGLRVELAAIPAPPFCVYDRSHVGEVNPVISATHPQLDMFENEIARFDKTLEGTTK